MPYDIIYADPPWSYRGQVQHGGADKPFTSSAECFYPTMSVEELCDMAPFVKGLAAKDCLLYMWIPGPLLIDGLIVMNAWGFEYKRDAFQWNKVAVNPGFYTMTQFETCYVGKRGKIPTPRGARNVRQYVEEKRTKHSRKPLEIARRIDEMHPTQSKIELFARPPHPAGWDVWGNEAQERK
jgi:N6-adenosine-specific RNA methylase IME4